MAPTVRPSTVTLARVTRWISAFILSLPAICNARRVACRGSAAPQQVVAEARLEG